LQVSPKAPDLYRAICEGILDKVRHIWDKMKDTGSRIPCRALWYAVHGQNEDILVWLLKQDFPLDSSAFKKALPDERRNVVDLILGSYTCARNPIPDEVCKALIDRKYEINGVELMSRLLTTKGSADLVQCAVSHGYYLTANLYSREIIDKFFTVQKLRELKHLPEDGLNELARALVKFKAVEQLWELGNGEHKKEFLSVFSTEFCVAHIRRALQEGWLEGAQFLLAYEREWDSEFELTHIHAEAARICGRQEVMDWAAKHGAPPPTGHGSCSLAQHILSSDSKCGISSDSLDNLNDKGKCTLARVNMC
jgi:hypothetical protein